MIYHDINTQCIYLITSIVISLAKKSEASTLTVAVKNVPPLDFASAFAVMTVVPAPEPARVMNDLPAGICTPSLEGE